MTASGTGLGRAQRCVILAALLLGAHTLPAQSPLPIFGPPVTFGADLELSEPLSFAQFRDGSFVYVELRSERITKVDRDGRLLWRVGRKGDGPGEFKVPYRVVVLPSQHVLVFDIGNARVTELRADGTYVDAMRTDMVVEIGNVIALPSGEIVMSGLTRDPRGTQKAIHVFSARLQHVRSFGPLADTPDVRLVQASGAGGLSLGLDGSIIHTRSYPFEVRRFDVTGREIQRFTERMRITNNGGRVSTVRDPRASRPAPVHEVAPGVLLGGLLRERPDSLLLIETDGRIRAAAAQPIAWGSLAFVDHVQKAVWFYGTRDDEPVLFRVPVRGR